MPLLVCSLVSCNKYLDKLPDNRVELKTPEQVAQMLVSAYPNFQNIVFLELLSDNTGFRTPLINRDTAQVSIFRFTDFSNDYGSRDNIWKGYYESIAVANQALDACKIDSTRFAYNRGEALLIRAYDHFMLVGLYAKPYNEGTADSDMGIPYVQEPVNDIQTKFHRNTVREVYQLIEKDLLEGMRLVDDTKYQNPAYRFTKRAAFAFATSFYLAKKDYASVQRYSSLLFPGNTINDYIRPYNTSYAMSENWAILYGGASEKANILLTSPADLINNDLSNVRYGLNDSIYRALYLRPTASGVSKWAFILKSELAKKNYREEKYPLKEVLIGNGYAYYYSNRCILSTEDVLFNQAESYIMQNQYDQALKLLNFWISKRASNYNAARHRLTLAKLTAYYPNNDTKTALMNEMLWYKRLEFMQTGMRWYDIIRLDLPVTHKDEYNKTFTLAPGSLQRQLLLPFYAIIQDGLQQNPR
ncbi:hypothetical protein BWD42_07750 [Sphingobacterium sp. CZ-UAM]|nr:hypothetical protein BWD42_07750 [Sphingobacterium sp. CZ-UAM]